MKTKFSQIVKLKQRRVDEIENEMLDVRNKKKVLLSKIEALEKEVLEIKVPKSGSFVEINITNMHLKNLSLQKKTCNENILLLDRQIEGLKVLYKEANIDYEKIKYLDNEEIKRILNEKKIEENKNMDEIANLLFSKHQRDAKV